MSDKKVSTFRERFIELIDSSPKTRSQIAEEFHVAKQTISAWYTGQTSPRLPAANALADYFNVSLGWILGYDVPKYVNKELQSSYEKYVHETIDLQDSLGALMDDESRLVFSYRSLSPRGKELLNDRAEELKLLYGKKSEDSSAESV